jgi:serine/threonine-protein kinase
MDPSAPSRVGRYQIVAELGRGAMGAVYRGTDPKLDRTVAIKMISAAMAGGDDRDEILARFEREARVSAKLQHPNVVAVYDVGSEGDDLYLVMELVDGETLGQRMARDRFPDPKEALELIAQAAEALAAAHEAGIIHRDIKPGNLMITRQGVLKVADFGVAKAVGEKTDLTRTGMMVGSPAYMSPEQVKGLTLDGRSDLFSLGVVLYEMLLHRKPFPADTVTTLVYQILHEDPMRDVPIPGAISNDLAEFLRWALTKDREQRIPDARTFASRARVLAAGGPLVHVEAISSLPTDATAAVPHPARAKPPAAWAQPPGAPSPGAPVATPAGSKVFLYVGAAAAVAAIGVGAALFLGRRQSAPESAPPPTAAQAPVIKVEPTERPAYQVPVETAPAEPQLTFEIPEEEPPPESSGDGITPGTTPKRPPAEKKPAKPAETPAAETTAGATAQSESASAQPAGFTVPTAVAETYVSRRAAQFHVRPDSAIVTINGVTIGKADDWDGFGGGKTYSFPRDGDYYAELVAPGYQTAWIKISIQPDAKDLTAKIRTKLVKIE